VSYTVLRALCMLAAPRGAPAAGGLVSELQVSDNQSIPRSDFWRNLIAGRWRVVRTTERGGRRFLVAQISHHRPRLGLSVREGQIADLLAQEQSQKVIAHHLGLSPSSVSTLTRSALRKLGLRSRVELLRLFSSTAGDVEGSDLRQRDDRVMLSFPALPVVSDDITGMLSPAEREVLSAVLTGASNVEIAHSRRTSPHTVMNQLASMFRKLGVSSRWELIARCSNNHASSAF
jgi:DNA-binding CsgD family transcriptional regulator